MSAFGSGSALAWVADRFAREDAEASERLKRAMEEPSEKPPPKETCDHGHPMDGIRTSGGQAGKRFCRTCNRERMRRAR